MKPARKKARLETKRKAYREPSVRGSTKRPGSLKK